MQKKLGENGPNMPLGVPKCWEIPNAPTKCSLALFFNLLHSVICLIPQKTFYKIWIFF